MDILLEDENVLTAYLTTLLEREGSLLIEADTSTKELLAIKFLLTNNIIVEVNENYLDQFRYDKGQLICLPENELKLIEWDVYYPLIDRYNTWSSFLSTDELFGDVRALELELFSIQIGDEGGCVKLLFGDKVLERWNKEDWIKDPNIVIAMARKIYSVCKCIE